MADNKYCDVCDLHLDKFSFATHVTGKKHNRRIQMQKAVNKNVFFEVHVSNLPQPYIKENVLQFFRQYGYIVNYNFVNNTTLALKYRDQKSALSLTQNKIYFRGQLLNIKSLKTNNVKDTHKNKKKNNQTKGQNSVISMINSNKTFEEQVCDIITYLQGPITLQQNKYDAVLKDLTLVLNEWFPCCLHKFGSTVTGLELQNSDIDIFVELLPKRPYHHLESMDYLKSTKRILSRSPLFRNVFGVFGAKTPIIKCEHSSTGVHCDINFKNSFGISNSELLKYLQSLDDRIKPLLLVIKCWAKELDLTGSNKITNYALAMMVVYYLQQQKILPSIQFLQMKANEGEEWNCTFDKAKGRLFKIENNDKLLDLLNNFYRFYEQFNFKNVISPLTSTFYARDDFSKLERIPQEYEAYKLKLSRGAGNFLKLESSIVVIDPFELSHNITPSTNDNILEMFKQSCSLSAKCFETSRKNEILYKLFSVKPSIKRKDKGVQEVEINLITDELLFQAQTIGVSDLQTLRKEWLHRVQEFVKQIMCEILFLIVQSVTVSPDRKAQRTENTDEVHSPNSTETFKYHCSGSTSVLKGRQKCKIVKANMSMFEHERVISGTMINTLGNTRPKKPLIDFHMTFNRIVDPMKLTLKLTYYSGHHPEFVLLADFCKKKMKKLIKEMLVESDMKLLKQNDKLKQNNDVNSTHNKVKEKPATSNENNTKFDQLRQGNHQVRHDVIPPGFNFF